MPATEAPGLSSLRIQRALRLNGIEDGRLLHSVHILDNEKRHSLRLLNQDSRLTSMTMESIHASSGISQEGLPPDAVLLDEGDDVGPCFAYGKRIKSRRFGKFRRTKSASTIHNWRSQNVNCEDGVLSVDNVKSLRPHSSPGGQWTLASASGTETPASAKRGSFSRRGSAGRDGTNAPITGYSGPPTLLPLRSAPPGFSRAGQSKREDQPKDDYAVGIQKSIAKVAAQSQLDSQIKEMVARIRKSRPSANQQSVPDVRVSVTKEKIVEKTPMEQAWAGRTSSPAKQLQLLDTKKSYHMANQNQLDLRLKTFLQNNPLRDEGTWLGKTKRSSMLIM